MVGGMFLWYNPAKPHTTLWSLQVGLGRWLRRWGEKKRKKKKCVENWDRQFSRVEKEGNNNDYNNNDKRIIKISDAWCSCSPPDDWCPPCPWATASPRDNSPQFYCSTWCCIAWNFPLISLGHLSWLCPFPTSCTHPDYSLAASEVGKTLTLC